MIDRLELGAWLRLTETPRLGRESVRKLLAAFGSPQAAIAASFGARGAVVPRVRANALADLPDAFEALPATTLAWLDAETPEPRA